MIKLGTIVGNRYEILEKIGIGGMAEVFKGKDHKLNRFVAIKVLKEEFRESQSFVKKFKEEAQAAAGLAHPNIVNVYDVGDENGIYYIVMEFVDGITLKTYIEKKGRLTVKEATSIAIQVSAGLEVAHNNHTVHRDIKPQNIMISREGKVKVTDFGIAKATTSETTTSSAMGSVHYASPEQARGGYVDHRSDIYSLGIVLYEMVTGRVPFDGDTAVSVAVKHLQEEIVPPSTYCKELSYSLEQIIKKCTQKSPDRRYQEIGLLLADLKQSLAEPNGDFVKIVDLEQQGKTVVMEKKPPTTVKPKPVPVKKPVVEIIEDEEEDEDEEDEEIISPIIEKVMTAAGVILAIIIVIVLFLLGTKVLGLRGDKDTTNPSQNVEQEQEEDKENKVNKEDKVEDKVEKEDKADEEQDTTDEEENTVTMPSLLGKTMTEAKIELNNLGLKITLKGNEYSSQYSFGQIAKQNIQAGESVTVGTSVQVWTASSDSGSNTSTEIPVQPEVKMVVVPKVTGQTEENARAALTAVGLKVGSVTETNSETVAKGLVVTQSLIENSSVEEGTSINLVLSSGPSKKKVTDVIGHDKDRAIKELEADGFKVSVKEEASNTIRKGLVISTSPNRGTYADPGSTVTMVVSKGIEKVKIPVVEVGMTYEEAEEALKAAGFKGTIVEDTEYSDSVGTNFVTRISPSNEVAVDGTVTIYISIGENPYPWYEEDEEQ